VRKGQVSVRFPPTTVAERFVVRATAGLPGEIGAVVAVTTAPSNRLLLDGRFQNSLDAPHWTYTGNLGPLTVFTNHQSRGAAWIEPPAGDASEAGTGAVHVVSNSATAPLVMDVDAPAGGTLVRSEEYAHGWTARLQPEGGGPTTVIDVQQDGLIQKVPIPPGKYIVTWKYAPTGVLVGLVFTALGAAIFLALLMVSSRRFWGRRGATA
jgi:hypothetical protein